MESNLEISLEDINDSTYNNDMVWYLNSSGEGFGNGDMQFNFTQGPGRTRTFRSQPRGNRNVQVRMALSIKEVMTENEKTINYKLPSGRDEFATVKIPAGVQHGVTFKFQGMGDDTIKNVPRGDLMVLMSVIDSDGYTRKGNDLYTDKTIDCFKAMRGYEFNLKTLDDKIIKEGFKKGQEMAQLFYKTYLEESEITFSI